MRIERSRPAPFLFWIYKIEGCLVLDVHHCLVGTLRPLAVLPVTSRRRLATTSGKCRWRFLILFLFHLSSKMTDHHFVLHLAILARWIICLLHAMASQRLSKCPMGTSSRFGPLQMLINNPRRCVIHSRFHPAARRHCTPGSSSGAKRRGASRVFLNIWRASSSTSFPTGSSFGGGVAHNPSANWLYHYKSERNARKRTTSGG